MMAEIIVQGHKVDTKDIYDIVDIEYDKKMFLNRMAGFIIRLIDKPEIRVYENIPYETYPHEISAIQEKWRDLRGAVTEKWQSDKNDLPIFKI